MNIVRHPRAVRTCDNCKITFRPRHPRHRLCGDCFAWRRAYVATMAARQALREAGL